MKSEVFHDWCLGGSQAVYCGGLAVSTGDRKKMRRGKPEGGKKSGFFLRIFSLTIKSRLFSMVFGIFSGSFTMLSYSLWRGNAM